ncbi:MAG: hypothetical protein ACE5F1_14720 [Planctomycetota bacterium]
MTNPAPVKPRRALRGISLPLALLLVAPLCSGQGKKTRIPPPVLPPADIKRLSKELSAWWDLEIKHIELQESGKKKTKKQRRRIRRASDQAQKAKAKFTEDFHKRGKRIGGIEKHVGDLLAIWDSCFDYRKVYGGGKVLKKHARGKKLPYWIRYPKTYDLSRRYPLIFALPYRTTDRRKERWISGKDYIERAWPAANEDALENVIVVCPELPDDMDLSSHVDMTKEDDPEELERRVFLFTVMGQVFNELRIHNDKVFLEASGESVPFALRVASAFPDRFAGLVLKSPQGAREAVFENLSNMSIAILHGGDKQKAMHLERKLKESGHNDVAIEQSGGELPFGEKSEWIHEWMKNVRRDLFAKKVVLAPAHDMFRKAYWVQITKAESLGETGLEQYRPRVEVTADRETNRVEVKARNVSEVRLYFNDLIVDLDKPITFILNGKTREEKRTRNLRLLTDLVFKRNDPRYIFLATGTYEIPEAEKDGAEAGSGKEPDGKGAGKAGADPGKDQSGK